MLKVQKFKDVFQGWCQSIDHDPSKDIKFTNNQHILQRIIEAVVYCDEHGIALRGHGEKEDQSLMKVNNDLETMGTSLLL